MIGAPDGKFLLRALDDFSDIAGSKSVKGQQQTQQEAQIADAIDHKGFCGCLCCSRTLILKSDQQIGSKPTPSHPTNSSSRLPARTSSSMEKTKKFKQAK